ncbi:hypothetical protein ACFL4C_00080 [Candidatus Omnitrophota bacterium]
MNNLKNKNELLVGSIAELKQKLEYEHDDKVVSSLKKVNQELKQGLDSTQVEAEKLNNDYTALKQEYAVIKHNMAQYEIDLARRADKILRSQDTLEAAQAEIEQLKTASAIQKEESASLRKKYVSRQLGNEVLRSQLIQYKQKIADLQAQIAEAAEANSLLQGKLEGISDILKTREQSQPLEPGSKKVAVELMPGISREVEDE